MCIYWRHFAKQLTTIYTIMLCQLLCELCGTRWRILYTVLTKLGLYFPECFPITFCICHSIHQRCCVLLHIAVWFPEWLIVLAKYTLCFCSPLHMPVPVQLAMSRSFPWQYGPPFWGCGLSHSLRLWCLQSGLHVDQDDHVDHIPGTERQ